MHGDEVLHEVLDLGYKLALGINAVVVERRPHIAHSYSYLQGWLS